MNPGRLTAVAIVVLVSFAAVAVVTLGVIVPRGSSPQASVTTTESPSAPTAEPAVRLPSSVVVADETYDTSRIHRPTADKPQSKLWFNDGIWWAVLIDSVGREYGIERLDWATQRWTDTGTVVDERPSAHVDALWDGRHLYVVSGGSKPSPSQAVRLTRFSYDSVHGRYQRDPDFPVALTASGVQAVNLTKDSKGRLWVSYMADQHLYVNRSLDSDVVWGQPFIPPVSGTAAAADDISSIIAFGPGKVGVMWSNQADDTLYFATHRDDAPDDEWQQTSTVISGLRNVDDHLSIKSLVSGDGGQVFAAVKTSLDTGPNPNPLAPQVLLVELDADGTWHTYAFGRVKDRHTRPIVLLDQEHRVLYVVAAAPFGGGAIYYKATSLDRISFETGLGIPLIAAGESAHLNDPTSTKQNLTSETGLVVLAADDRAGQYFHAAVGLGGPPPETGTPRFFAAPPPGRSVLLDQTFNPWPAGAAAPGPWTSPQAGQNGTVKIVEVRSGDHAVGLTNRGSVGSVSTCARWQPVTGGTLVVTLDVLVSARGRQDTPIASVGGPGGTAAAVRFGLSGGLAYYDGQTRVATQATYRLGTWYRSRIVLDLARRTYDWTITRRGAPRALLNVGGIRWRTGSLGSLDKLCIATPPDAAGASLTFDNVSVEH